MNEFIEKYVSLVDFLADFLGNDAEVVLHDTTNLDKSVVAIRNNHISGRELGAPATDLVLQKINDGDDFKNPFICNYRGVSISGKQLKCATYFIRDDEDKIAGILCINMEVDKLHQAQSFLNSFLGTPTQEVHSEQPSETLSKSVKQLTLESVHKIVNELNIPPERMDQDEKILVVSELNNNGIFLIKGAVSEAAHALKVSEATIYRYLGIIKKK